METKKEGGPSAITPEYQNSSLGISQGLQTLSRNRPPLPENLTKEQKEVLEKVDKVIEEVRKKIVDSIAGKKAGENVKFDVQRVFTKEECDILNSLTNNTDVKKHFFIDQRYNLNSLFITDGVKEPIKKEFSKIRTTSDDLINVDNSGVTQNALSRRITVKVDFTYNGKYQGLRETN